MGSPAREGSVTVVGAVSPQGGDMAEPVCAATLNIVQVFWQLDKKLAQVKPFQNSFSFIQRKHFPSVNWLHSWSRYEDALEPFYDDLDSEFISIRTKIKKIFQMEDDLTQIVQLVGKDSLNESDKVTLTVSWLSSFLIFQIAEVLRNDFLQQNGFTKHDRYCPFHKTIWMMRNFVTYYDLALQVLETSTPDQKVTWAHIRKTTEKSFLSLSKMKFIVSFWNSPIY